MTNKITNFWRSIKFWFALKRGNNSLANQILKAIENSGAKLSPLEKLYQDKLKFQESLNDKDREISNLSKHLKKAVDKLDELELKIDFDEPVIRRLDDYILTPEPKFIEFVTKTFQLIEKDESLWQCTGIDERIFDDFESSLAEYIKSELERIPEKKRPSELEEAIKDMQLLKGNTDPDYGFKLTPHVYMMKHFPDHVYSSYLAWFLIYKSGLLPTKLNILDIGAGPGTVAYGLALFLQSSSGFFPTPPMHICYYSLEKQAQFQYRGLQFWRQYIEEQRMPTNLYFRFDTTDILKYNEQSKVLPKSFFDFIVISHCLFRDSEENKKSCEVYRKIFQESLISGGYVVLIVQVNSFFGFHEMQPKEDISLERKLVEKLVEELDLKLEWFKYITSTGIRESKKDFLKYANEHLPPQKFMTPLKRKYLKLNYNSNYGLDDYIILAKR
ncbi:photosystem II assembly protein [Hydrocoleum sp. CS-953]|uniref:photosystem II assembly protein n=1 Tax=Hydrocoleum sp. CS-953 TaxID=1671698 RepID=UPI000BDAC12C|nr:photosystem II assembly protein [Hydrocoleum sp. CS-953]OZH55770.1 photosystem II assembly protein [Hydrocoleum sp. CS-953]